MNNTSQCIFDISHVLRSIRDTMELVLPNQIKEEVYKQRKAILNTVMDPKSFLGKFIKDNEEKLTEFKQKYQEFFDDIYGDNSTICTIAEGQVRVDHAQNIKILQHVVYISETIRDIMFSHVNFARQNNQLEENIMKHVEADERFDRIIKDFLLIQEYQKSFMEFQKVMGESKGKPTPQSNFIVQNELNVLAGMIRFNRDHCHAMDNKTWDALDDTVELVQSCEGRRERRDGKAFPDLFSNLIKEIGEDVNVFGPAYNEGYQANLKDMLDTIKANQENKKNEAPQA